jgi:hypothetical protein
VKRGKDQKSLQLLDRSIMAANKLMNVVAVVVCLMVMVNAASAVGKAKCTDKWYPRCYGYQYDCPANCPYNCDMDCKTCKTVCRK